jgi:hypothetical protein
MLTASEIVRQLQQLLEERSDLYVEVDGKRIKAIEFRREDLPEGRRFFFNLVLFERESDDTTIEDKVAEWNETYAGMCVEIPFDALVPEAYEAQVGYALLDVCGGDVGLALEVFGHSDNKGGWASGDVATFLKHKRDI